MCAVRLVIVDDHEVVRRGLAALIGEQRGWQLLAEAQDGREALTRVAKLNSCLSLGRKSNRTRCTCPQHVDSMSVDFNVQKPTRNYLETGISHRDVFA